MAKKKEQTLPAETKLRRNIYQSNPIIQARKEMGTIGLRLFMLGLRGINPHLSANDKLFDTEFKETFISTAKLTELFGGNTAYLHEMKKTCLKMLRTIIELRREDGGWELFGVFKRIAYIPAEGLYIEFNDLMRPYLLDLFKSRGYTQIDVEQIFHLTSPYAVRLIELLLQYQNIPEMKTRQLIERTLTLEELRFSLNVPAGVYVDRMDNFRRFVLNEPIREINEKTSYKMRYEVQKTGVRITGFKFFLDTSALPRKIEAMDPLAGNALSRLKELGFGVQAAQSILAKCDGAEDCMKRILSATRSLTMKKRRGGKVDNELGYLRKYIEEDWTAKNSVAVEEPEKPKSKPKPKKPEPPRKGEPTSLKEIFQAMGVIMPQTPPAPQEHPPKSEPTPPPQLQPRIELKALREPSANEFQQGEKPVSAGIARMAAEALAGGEVGESVQLILALSGLTIERFRELYM